MWRGIIKSSRLILVLISMSAAVLLYPTTISATTLYVDKDGSGDFQSIAVAVMVASTGDTVLVSPGTYHESTVTIYDKSIFLISTNGPEETSIVYLGIPGSILHSVIDVCDATSPGCIIGFTITGASGGFDSGGGGISIIRSAVLVSNNIITRNWCANGGGIWCSGTPYPTIENNLISFNEGWIGGGIHIFRCSPIIRFNTIAHNYADVAGGGIDIRHEMTSPTIEHNIIAFNLSPQGGGIASSTPDTNITFSCNNVFSNANSNYYDQIQDRTGIDGNISLDPLFCGETGSYNYLLQINSPCSETNVPEECGMVRMGCRPVACNVSTESSSWGSIKSRFKGGGK